MIDVIRDKNLVKPKGTKKRHRHKIKEDRAKECAHREAVQQQIARDKTEREDDRMRCRRDSVLKLPHPHLQLS